jgi:glycosyltransferase involved in cell wall biosynthesis
MASTTPHKGHHYLVEAARLIARQRGREAIRVRILGQTLDPDYDRMLRARVAALELELVEILGWVANVSDQLAQTDVVVSASIDRDRLEIGGRRVDVANAEGTPRQILEALAAGVPVVATRIPGTEDVVEHERTGLLVAPRSSEQLAAAILRLLDDPGEADRMAAAGRKAVASRHRPEESARRIADLYGVLVAR